MLEMIGDLPEADAKPPSNVLFVCKLNPVTSEVGRALPAQSAHVQLLANTVLWVTINDGW